MYIHVFCVALDLAMPSPLVEPVVVVLGDVPWVRTNGVNTNGAAAKAMNFDRLGKKVRLALLGR